MTCTRTGRGASPGVDVTGLCDMADADLVEFADALLAGAARQPPCADSDAADELPTADSPAPGGSDNRPGATTVPRCEANREHMC